MGKMISENITKTKQKPFNWELIGGKVGEYHQKDTVKM